jgi:hypothetical protein
VEVGIAFAGILLGWLLSLASQVWIERRTARRAGRLVTIELMANASTLKHAAETPVRRWGERPMIRTTAWESQAMTVQAILNEDEAKTLMEAYHGLSNAQRIFDVSFNTITSATKDHDAAVDKAVSEFQLANAREGDKRRQGENARSSDELRSIFDERQRSAEEIFEVAAGGLDTLFEDRPLDNTVAKLTEASQLLGQKVF